MIDSWYFMFFWTLVEALALKTVPMGGMMVARIVPKIVRVETAVPGWRVEFVSQNEMPRSVQ